MAFFKKFGKIFSNTESEKMDKTDLQISIDEFSKTQTPLKNKYPALDYLSSNRISRKTLVQASGMTDRSIRRQIHALRMKGYKIISDTNEGGYWLGTNAEWDNFCNQQRRRAINNFYRKSNEIDGQIKIEFIKE